MNTDANPTADDSSKADPNAHDDGDKGTPSDDPAVGADGVEVPTADERKVVAPDAPAEGAVGTSAQALTRVSSPVPGYGVNYAYGVRNARYAAGFHTGEDHAAPLGTGAVAVRSGTIRWSNDSGGSYGRWIGLDADNGRTYVYCHLSSRLVGAGARVTAGQTVGRVGATGNVTGPHLHFEDHPRGAFRYAQVRKPSW